MKKSLHDWNIKLRICKILSLLILIAFIFHSGSISAQNPTDIIRKAENKFQGEKSSYTQMDMVIKRPKWERTISFKNWTKGKELALTLITDPAKEKGQSFLKVHNEMWNWSPAISRMIKMPPSMLSQGWMGSDYTNDDLLKEASLERDYTHKIIGNEVYANVDCWKIELIPKEDAIIVWGKLIKWISKEGMDQLKTEYYDEDFLLVKTELASHLKKLDNRIIPTQFEIIPADKPDQRTILILNEVKFNPEIPDSFFSQQNMKKVK